MDDTVVKTYQLSGGAKVTTFKPFGANIYAAIVEMDGSYPEAGKRARNSGRTEMITILDGRFEIEVDSKRHTVKQNQSILISDGAVYRIVGKGRSLVLVCDKPDGQTEIVPGALL